MYIVYTHIFCSHAINLNPIKDNFFPMQSWFLLLSNIKTPSLTNKNMFNFLSWDTFDLEYYFHFYLVSMETNKITKPTLISTIIVIIKAPGVSGLHLLVYLYSIVI